MAEYQKAIALNDDPLPLALLGRLYERIGQKDGALTILKRLHEVSSQRYISPYNFALVEMGLGRKDEAVRLLEQAMRNTMAMTLLSLEPIRS